MNPFSSEALDLIASLRSCGGEAWIVGGAVRDAILKRPFADEDIATNLPAAFITEHFLGTPTFPGTNLVKWQNKFFEVTTYRIDQGTNDYRHPARIRPASSLAEDAKRRDFTINAIYTDGVTWWDPVGGKRDLDQGIIRAIGVAQERFKEDALRVLRALRLASELDFTIAPDTWSAMEYAIGLVKMVARERVVNEMTRLFRGKGASRILKDYGRILWAIFPQMSPKALKGIPSGVDEVRAGFWLLLGHDDFLRWPLPKDIRKTCQALLRLEKEDVSTDEGLLSAVLAEGESTSRIHLILSFGTDERLSDLAQRGVPLSLSSLALNGDDLKALGIAPHDIGCVMRRLCYAILQGECANTTQALTNLLEKKLAIPKDS